MHPATGIVVADGERLILRPSPVRFRRRSLLRVTAVLAVIIIGVALLLAWLARPYLTYGRALVAAAIVFLVYAYQLTTQVTFVALRSGDGIYVETKNRLLRVRRRKLLHRYGDLRAVRLRSRVNPNAAHPGASPMGAYRHYDVLLEKDERNELLWYTRYPDGAAAIAKAIADFANVPVIDDENIRSASRGGQYPPGFFRNRQTILQATVQLRAWLST